jgi:hypothetical protein
MRPERMALTGDQSLAAAIDTARRALGWRGPPLGDIKRACLDDPRRIVDLMLELRAAAARRLVDARVENVAPTLVLPLDRAEGLFSADAGPQADQFLALIANALQ